MCTKYTYTESENAQSLANDVAKIINFLQLPTYKYFRFYRLSYTCTKSCRNISFTIIYNTVKIKIQYSCKNILLKLINFPIALI